MMFLLQTDEGDQQVPKPAFAHAGAKRKHREVHKQSERVSLL